MNDKPVEPIDITKERAFIAYVLTGVVTQTARIVKVNNDTVTRWIEEGDWATARQAYYDEVHKHTTELLHENLAEKQATIAAKALEWLESMMLTDLAGAEAGSKLDLWKAFDTGITAVGRLLGAVQGEKQEADNRPIIQLSGEGQKVYLQSIQKLGIINARNTEDLSEHSGIRPSRRREEKHLNGRQIPIPDVDQGESEA